MLFAWRERFAPTYRFAHERVLGTSLELTIRAISETAARRAEARALAEIDRLEPVFSAYDPTSELSRWQEHVGEAVVLSPELFGVLDVAEQWLGVSGGAFHPAVESLTRLWRCAVQNGVAPEPNVVAAVQKALVAQPWTLDRHTTSAIRHTSGPLTLNALAKGEIVDRAVAAAWGSAGDILGIVVNIGGDLRVRTSRPVRVGIADPNQDAENAPPLATIQLTDGALAASGGYRRGFSVGDTWYSHLLDPRTGYPVPAGVSAAVIAPTAAVADVLSTLSCVLGPEPAFALVERVDGAALLRVGESGERHASARWAQFSVESVGILGIH